MNARELLYLAKQHAVANGEPIDRGADVEMAVTYHGRCHHVIITADGDMWVDGWIVSSCQTPDAIHSVNQHADLTNEAVQKLRKRFELAKSGLASCA